MWSSRKAAWGIRILERYKNCRDGKAKALFWRKETSSVQLKLRGIAGHKLHIYILKVSRQVPQATIVVVQLLSRVQLFVTSWTAARQASLSFISWSLLKLMSIECHPTISSSIAPFSSCPQSFPASGSFSMNRLLELGSQSIGASASASVLAMNIQGWFPLGLTGLISMLSKGLFSSTTVQKHQFCGAQPSLWSSSHILTTGKTTALTIYTFVHKVMSLLFNTLPRFITAFLPRSKHLLISWLQSPSAVTLEPKKIKFVTVSTFSSSICHEPMRLDARISVFWMLNFSLSSFTLIKSLFSFSLLSAIRVVSSTYLRLLIFLPAILIQLVIHLARHFTLMSLCLYVK